MARRYRPAHAAPKPARSGKQRAAIGTGAVVAVLLLVAAGAVYSVNRKFDLIPRLSANTRLDEAADDEPKNYLVVGSDSREDLDPDAADAGSYLGGDETPEGKRADVIMIVRVDPEGQRLDILSLQRDLWVPISGTGANQRINTAYSGGAQQLIDTIRDDFGIEIHHYVEVDFEGFKGIVDTVDGVPLYFDRAMRDTNSGLNIMEPGCVTLDGEQALAFARARHLQYMKDGVWRDDPTGDLGRISRQQVFMRRMFDRAASKVSFTDLRSMNDLADIAIDYVTIDHDLEITKAINVAKQFGTFEGESIQSYTLPVEGFTTDGGAAVLRYDPIAAQPILNVFRDVPVTGVDPSLVEVQVSNGSGTPMQATDTSNALSFVGFTTEILADSPDQATTTVRYAPGSEPQARTVARYVAGGAELSEDVGLPEGTVVLTTGTDFTSILSSPLPDDDPAIRAATTPTTTASEPDGDAGTSPAPAPTTSTTVGVTPGEAPPGVECDG